MRLALFSYNVTKVAATKLATWVGKKPEEINITYITTAANTYPPNPVWLLHTRKQLQKYGFNVEDFDLEKAYKNKVDLDKYLSDKDIIFISGGNVFYLMHWVYETKFDKLLKTFLNKGLVYAGASAGTVCLVDDIKPMGLADKPDLAPSNITKGLGFIDFAPIPHWEVVKYQEKLEKIKGIYEKKNYKTYTITDNDALFVENDKIIKV